MTMFQCSTARQTSLNPIISALPDLICKISVPITHRKFPEFFKTFAFNPRVILMGNIDNQSMGDEFCSGPLYVEILLTKMCELNSR